MKYEEHIEKSVRSMFTKYRKTHSESWTNGQEFRLESSIFSTLFNVFVLMFLAEHLNDQMFESEAIAANTSNNSCKHAFFSLNNLFVGLARCKFDGKCNAPA